jgi:hypothetical protein
MLSVCDWFEDWYHTFFTFLVAWMLGLTGKLFVKIKIQYSVTTNLFKCCICDRLNMLLRMDPLLLCVVCYTCKTWCHFAVTYIYIYSFIQFQLAILLKKYWTRQHRSTITLYTHFQSAQHSQSMNRNQYQLPIKTIIIKHRQFTTV